MVKREIFVQRPFLTMKMNNLKKSIKLSFQQFTEEETRSHCSIESNKESALNLNLKFQWKHDSNDFVFDWFHSEGKEFSMHSNKSFWN